MFKLLDLEIYILQNKIYHKLWFKPTHSHLTLTKKSYHPNHVHRGVIYSQIYRAMTHRSTKENFLNARNEMTKVWKEIGITRSLIRKIEKSIFDMTNQWNFWETGFNPCERETCVCSRIGSFLTQNFTLVTLEKKFLKKFQKVSCHHS